MKTDKTKHEMTVISKSIAGAKRQVKNIRALMTKKVKIKAIKTGIEYKVTWENAPIGKAIKKQWEKLIRYDGKYHYYIARNGRKVFTDRKR